MTCCEEDIQFIGFKCKYENAKDISHKSWVDLTAEVHYEFAKEYRGKGPVLYAKEVSLRRRPGKNWFILTRSGNTDIVKKENLGLTKQKKSIILVSIQNKTLRKE